MIVEPVLQVFYGFIKIKLMERIFQFIGSIFHNDHCKNIFLRQRFVYELDIRFAEMNTRK